MGEGATATDRGQQPHLASTEVQGPTAPVDASELERKLRSIPNAKLRVEDELVYELLTYGDGESSKLGIGNWCRGETMAKAVLTYLAMRAFGIHRLPWHHDHSFAIVPIDRNRDSALRVLSDERRVEAACAQLRRLHDHTIAVLRACGASHVTLRRGLVDAENKPHGVYGHTSGYATRLAKMAAVAQRLDLREIGVPFDVLSSWSAGGYSFYSVVIEHTLPVESIGWCAAVLATADRSNPDRPASEGGEWVVLNRAIDGRLWLPATCVVKASVKLPDLSRWDSGTLRTELEEDERTYGPLSSMYRDRQHGMNRIGWRERVRRAWELLRHPYA